MIFLTWTYFAFLLGAFLLYWFVLPQVWRKSFLLITSTSFFFYHFPSPAILLLLLMLTVYLIALLMVKVKKQGIILILAVVLVISPLLVYKYSELTVSTINSLVLLLGKRRQLEIPQLLVPLGISFFTFKFIHYLVDIYRGAITKVSFINLAFYMLFIPTLPSGPIERYQNFIGQSEEQAGFRMEYLTEGVCRLLAGLGKKFIIADSMGVFIAVLDTGNSPQSAYWLGMYAYALKIYFDFSGYSDVAIGSSRLFGYRIIENFNWPYLQRNLALFWKNWHISLTGWFRDYIFIPLGGSRVAFPLIIVNTFVVMAVTGLWHGAAWHFVFWGLYHGIGLIVLRLWDKYVAAKLGAWYGRSRLLMVMSTLLTFHFVSFGWIFFVVDVQQGWTIVTKMLTGI